MALGKLHRPGCDLGLPLGRGSAAVGCDISVAAAEDPHNAFVEVNPHMEVRSGFQTSEGGSSKPLPLSYRQIHQLEGLHEVTDGGVHSSVDVVDSRSASGRVIGMPLSLRKDYPCGGERL